MTSLDKTDLESSEVIRHKYTSLLSQLLPEVFRDGELDVGALQELLLDDHKNEGRFGLHWSGKAEARRAALTPSRRTLRPDTTSSLEWDVTRNVILEGDNLEVLKILQRSYAGKIKLIYIDPPYNTGNDFVYSDHYSSELSEYYARTGQTEGGRQVSSNSESGGRFHANWLNMIYPRLKLARELLQDDGIILISIDDNEVHHLRAVCDELYGQENFVGQFVWKRRSGAMDAANNLSADHEYVVAYSKSFVVLNGVARTFERYANPDNDPRGPWIADNLSAAKPGGDTFYAITDPSTGVEYWPPRGRYWPYSRATMAQKIREGRIIFPSRSGGTPLLKRFQQEAKSLTQPFSTWITPGARESVFQGELTAGYTSEGTKTIKELFDDKVFTYAKPISLLDSLLSQFTANDEDQIVLDFFAGTGTTGHAVINRNALDGGKRRFILVQLQEPLSPDIEEQQAAARFCQTLGVPLNIAELTKERLRRAGHAVKTNYPQWHGDVGFRAFKLDSSNFTEWDPSTSRGDVEAALLDAVNNIKPDRAEQDVLFELLLKLGLELTTPIETREIAGKKVHSVGAGTLVVCLERGIDGSNYKALGQGMAEWTEAQDAPGGTNVIFLDASFSDDVVKTNIATLLDQRATVLGKTWTVRSV